MGAIGLTFVLADGQIVVVAEDDVRRLYDELWLLSSEPGAVSTAALLLHELRQRPIRIRPTELTPPQSRVLRRALGQTCATRRIQPAP